MTTSPEINVMETEEPVWKGSVSHWHYAGKWFVVLLLLIGVVATFFLDPTQWGNVNPWIIRAIPVAGIILLVLWITIDRRRRAYVVTNRRVSVEYGLVSKRSNELRIQDIRSINLTTTGFAGLLGIGRLEFSSAASDDADVVFWNIPEAERVRDLVRSLQTAVAT